MRRSAITLTRVATARAHHALLPAASRAPPPLLLQSQRRWNQQAAAESHIFDEHDAFRRRLLYRSKQRGWLEMDLMLGSWVRAN